MYAGAWQEHLSNKGQDINMSHVHDGGDVPSRGALATLHSEAHGTVEAAYRMRTLDSRDGVVVGDQRAQLCHALDPDAPRQFIAGDVQNLHSAEPHRNFGACHVRRLRNDSIHASMHLMVEGPSVQAALSVPSSKKQVQFSDGTAWPLAAYGDRATTVILTSVASAPCLSGLTCSSGMLSGGRAVMLLCATDNHLRAECAASASKDASRLPPRSSRIRRGNEGRTVTCSGRELC